jgi:hypothetical protein
MGHCHLNIIEYQTKIRPDLRETPFWMDLGCLWMGPLELFKEKDIKIFSGRWSQIKLSNQEFYPIVHSDL